MNLNHVADMVQKQRTASIKEFEISYDDDGKMWRVSGAGLQRFIQMTNWRCETSWQLFVICIKYEMLVL